MPAENKKYQCSKQVLIMMTVWIITSLILLWLGWNIYSTYHARTLTQEHSYKTQNLYQRIIYLDEVLTMSARMAASTGAPRWETRYHQFEPQLDAAIIEAKALAKYTATDAAPEQTDAANQALIKMELQAFELAKQGRLIEAQGLLFGGEYEKQKQLYKMGALSFSRTTNEVLRLTQLQGVILHLDEILTMSARMAAATGDPRWEQRYRQFEPQLEAAIIEAGGLTAAAFSSSVTDQTNTANNVLVEMENQAFTLVRNNQLAEAQKLLQSEKYEENKQIYAAGLMELEQALTQIANLQTQTEKQHAFAQVSQITIVIVGLITIWLFILWLTRRWQATLSEKNNELKERSTALAALNGTLEARVEERTAEIQTAQEELKHQALHDALTELPNRYAMTEFLEHEISRASRHNYFSAVLFLDLDNFKSINDVQGHGTGDQVLKIVAERLNQCRRTEDFLGRFGGDEFVLVLTELDADLQIAAELAQVAAQRIIKTLDEPIFLADHKLIASCCIGIKLFPGTQEETCGDLLKQADMALYHAKDKGQGVVSFFYEDMQKLLEQRHKLAREIQEGLEQEQFYLYYQPQVNIDAQVFGVEALLRWNHPTRGMVGPDEFIPIAEEAGLINELGRYVLHHTLKEWSKFLAEGVCESIMKVAVNISPSHFLEADFVDQIKHILSSYDLQNCHLVLEITEGVVIQDIADISAKMEALRQLGVGLSLDDFGTGYSSLAYLKRLPLDTLKIDRSFVRDIHLDPNDAAIVEAILAMAASLGIDVIAEGVETDAQRQFLEQRGCILYQGYLFSRPAPLNELVEKRVFEQLIKPLAVQKSIQSTA